MKEHSFQNEEFNLACNEFLQSTSDVFYTVDKNWRLKYLNKSAENFLNMNSDELIGRSIFEIFPDYAASEWYKEQLSVMEKRIPVRFETFLEKIMNWVEMFVYPMSTGGIIVYFHELVKLKLKDTNKQKQIELNLAFLSDVTNELNYLTSVSEIIKTVGEKLVRYLKLSACYFIEVDEASDTVNFSEGWIVPYIKPIYSGSYKLSEFYTVDGYKTVHAGKTVIVSDVQNDTRSYAKYYKSTGISAFVVVPYLNSGILSNLLLILSTHVRNWRDDEIELLEELSNRVFQRIERSKAEEKLMFQAKLLSNVHDAICAVDENYIITYWSEMAEKLFGWTTEEAIRKPYHELLKTDSKSQDYFMPFINDIFVGEVTYLNKAGKKIYTNVHSSILRSNYGEFKGIVSSFWDITERKLAEATIRKQNEQFRALITVLSESSLLSIVDKDGNYLKYSNIVKEYSFINIVNNKAGTSYKRNTYFDETGVELAFEEIPVMRVLRGETLLSYRYKMVSQKGDKFYFTNGIPIFDENGQVELGILITFDITDEVEKEKAIRSHQESIIKLQLDKNEALKRAMDMKDEFLSLISHEFKTPLTVINSAMQMLDIFCKNDISDKAKSYLVKIRQNSNRLLKLINNLLDITRLNAGGLKVNRLNLDIVSLTRSITESIRTYAEHKNIRLSFSSTIKKRIIGIDDEKYERILLNLLSNAIKYTPEGKSISVRLSMKVSDRRKMVCIVVSDYGIGIPADKQELIFERFGQVDSSLSRQAEGTGIGLYLTRMFVNLLGGKIILKSEEGKGSTFTVLLPSAIENITPLEIMAQENSDNRLIQSTVIEFSDIYM